MRNYRFIFFVPIFLFSFFTLTLQSATITVPTDFPTIQGAINASSNGDTVLVLPGTYVEAPLINAKSITLAGSGAANTFIVAPNVLPNLFIYTPIPRTFVPVLTVTNAASVTVQDITVDGNDKGASANPNFFVGIGYHNSGGTIQNVNVINVTLSAAPGTQTGNGIQIANDVGTNAVSILNSTFSVIQRTFVSVRGIGLTVTVDGNTMTGRTGLSAGSAAQNGVTVQDSATGVVSNNNITQMQCPTPPFDSTGILPFNAGSNLQILNNTVTRSDLGIAAVNTGDNLLVEGNQCNDNTTVSATGIFIQDPMGTTTLTENTLANNGNIGMHLDTGSSPNVSPDNPLITVQLIVLNPLFFLHRNNFINGPIGLEVQGIGTSGPIVAMDSDIFENQSNYFIIMNACPNDIWPTTSTVSFNGLIVGVNMTFQQFQETLTKIIDKHNDPSLGLVLDFIPPQPVNFTGKVRRNNCFPYKCCLIASWTPIDDTSIVAYRIFQNGIIVAEIPATGPFKFRTSVSCCPRKIPNFAIASVDVNGQQGNLVPITIVCRSR